MKSLYTPSRRHFLATTAFSASTLYQEFGNAVEKGKLELCVFNKPLQHLNYADQAELVAEMGFTGIEGTVRKGGHVVPEKVADDLPRQMEALKTNGLEMAIMTTDVNDIDSAIHRQVLKTAASLGVKRFRMGGIKYDAKQPLPTQLQEIRGRFKDLAEFCKQLNIQPLYQNHSGANRFGAGIWDLCDVVKDLSETGAGIAFDIRHAVVEGGLSWPTEFQLARPFFGAVYCKDFEWLKDTKRPQNVPLGTGMVDYKGFLKMLLKSGYSGPVSLHMEYKNHRDPALLQESIAAIRSDKKRFLEILDEVKG
ncbi:MAG: sugar phosphate isomerase/epimerase [Verrucomicrobiales bacterium]|nr:sugar phosphate isomerase/epimerase [Verrucomicrobiales bacterium]